MGCWAVGRVRQTVMIGNLMGSVLEALWAMLGGLGSAVSFNIGEHLHGIASMGREL